MKEVRMAQSVLGEPKNGMKHSSFYLVQAIWGNKQLCNVTKYGDHPDIIRMHIQLDGGLSRLNALDSGLALSNLLCPVQAPSARSNVKT